MKLHVLGIDLGKTGFHAVGVDSTGKVVVGGASESKHPIYFQRSAMPHFA